MANKQEVLDTAFHALADPTRRAVIQRLGCSDATVSELAEPFDITLPTFMKHIGVLEASGLVESKKTGRVRTCKLNKQKLAAVQDWFDIQRHLWEGQADRIAHYAEILSTNNKTI